MYILLGILAYLAATSVIAYRAFARDKQLAEANRGIPRDKSHAAQRVSRIPEAKLLFFAIIGGWPGAKYAQRKLRHKSYKQPFGKQLNDIGLLHGAVVGTVAVVIAVLLLGAPPAPDAPGTAKAAAPAQQHAPAPPHLSLRPPAARPATL
tara:strand:+ start:716 stop:1165 length:450 start_codon:yes stop_codon:yes gene_type:complete